MKFGWSCAMAFWSYGHVWTTFQRLTCNQHLQHLPVSGRDHEQDEQVELTNSVGWTSLATSYFHLFSCDQGAWVNWPISHPTWVQDGPRGPEAYSHQTGGKKPAQQQSWCWTVGYDHSAGWFVAVHVVYCRSIYVSLFLNVFFWECWEQRHFSNIDGMILMRSPNWLIGKFIGRPQFLYRTIVTIVETHGFPADVPLNQSLFVWLFGLCSQAFIGFVCFFGVALPLICLVTALLQLGSWCLESTYAATSC